MEVQELLTNQGFSKAEGLAYTLEISDKSYIQVLAYTPDQCYLLSADLYSKSGVVICRNVFEARHVDFPHELSAYLKSFSSEDLDYSPYRGLEDA